MKTLRRVCIKDWEVTAENGDCCKISRGKEYITSPNKDDGTCIVFTRFWVPVPVEYFAGEEVFTTS